MAADKAGATGQQKALRHPPAPRYLCSRDNRGPARRFPDEEKDVVEHDLQPGFSYPYARARAHGTLNSLRLARINPTDQHETIAVPELRIIDDVTWQRVRARQQNVRTEIGRTAEARGIRRR